MPEPRTRMTITICMTISRSGGHSSEHQSALAGALTPPAQSGCALASRAASGVSPHTFESIAFATFPECAAKWQRSPLLPRLLLLLPAARLFHTPPAHRPAAQTAAQRCAFPRPPALRALLLPSSPLLCTTPPSIPARARALCIALGKGMRPVRTVRPAPEPTRS